MAMTFDAVIVYTDGSSSKSREGGWAALIATQKNVTELVGWEDDTTNNRMEMVAAIEGLKYIKKPSRVYLASDSAYVINAIDKEWYKRWLSDEHQRPNLDLWTDLASLVEFHTIIPIKVKGHSNDLINRRVDKLAQQARKEKLSHIRKYTKAQMEAFTEPY